MPSLLGCGAGKSAFCVQYVEGHFVESYNPTIESTFWKTVTYKGERIAVSIRDTAGQSEVCVGDCLCPIWSHARACACTQIVECRAYRCVIAVPSVVCGC